MYWYIAYQLSFIETKIAGLLSYQYEKSVITNFKAVTNITAIETNYKLS